MRPGAWWCGGVVVAQWEQTMGTELVAPRVESCAGDAPGHYPPASDDDSMVLQFLNLYYLNTAVRLTGSGYRSP